MNHNTAMPTDPPAGTEQAWYDRISLEIEAAAVRTGSPNLLTTISEYADLLRTNTTPTGRGARRASLDYLHTHALTEHALRQAFAYPHRPGEMYRAVANDQRSLPAALSNQLVVVGRRHGRHVRDGVVTYRTRTNPTPRVRPARTGGESPVDAAAVQAVIDRFFATTTADERLLAMLTNLPAAMYAAAEQDGYTEGSDEVRQAFEAGCALITEAVAEWLTTHTLVALPVLASAAPRPVVEIAGPDEHVTGFLDDDGKPFVQAGYVVWNGAVAEQTALGILAVLRALRTAGGEA